MKRNPVSSTYRNSSPALSLIGALAELRDSGRLSQCQMDAIMSEFDKIFEEEIRERILSQDLPDISVETNLSDYNVGPQRLIFEGNNATASVLNKEIAIDQVKAHVTQ